MSPKIKKLKIEIKKLEVEIKERKLELQNVRNKCVHIWGEVN